MGTLNWLPREGGFAFSLRCASAAGASTAGAPVRLERPDPVTGQPTRVLALLELEGEGARLSVNEYGLGLCWLELPGSRALGEAAEAHGARRRGELLLGLSGCRSEVELSAQLLSKVQVEGCLPFLLGVFSAGRPPTFFEWDGRGLSQRLATLPPLIGGGGPPQTELAERGRLRGPRHGAQSRRGPQRIDELLRGCPAAGRRSFGRLRAGVRPEPAAGLWLVLVDGPSARVESFAEEKASSRVHSLPLAEDCVARAASVSPLQAPERTFDVPSLFAERGRGVYARLPRWVLRSIAQAVGQQAVNRFLFGLGPMPAEAFPEACLRRLRVEVRALHSLPCRFERPPVYVANHPLGGVDGLALLALCLRRHGRTQAPVNPLLTRIPHLAELCVPLDAERNPRGLPAMLRRVFQSQQPIALFPAGSASRRSGGVLADGPWGPMVASYCLRYGRPVIPVFIGGHNSMKFYATASARKRLRVGINLEMFLLPREALSPVVRRLDMHVGPPVAPEELAGLGATNLERAAALRERCYQLGSAL